MSEFSRETLLNIIETGHVQCGEASALARMALAAMDSEPHTDDELSNLLWYSQEATCHSDPNYYCEFQRLATPGLIAGIIRELQERRKAAMDSKPVILYRQINPVNGMKTYWAELDPEEFRHLKQHTDENAEFMTLYRHAQPAPVVPDEIKHRIGGLDWGWEGEFNRGWNACRAAMLAAAQHDTPALNPVQSVVTVPGKWIPVSERLPEVGDIVLTAMGGVVNVGETECSAANCRFFTSVISGRELPATHWMPLPAGPQGVKGE
ncbi:DUF551 domain-containing protein [Klebsiella pneumoniae]